MYLQIICDNDENWIAYHNSGKFSYRPYDSSLDLMNVEDDIELQPFETRLVHTDIRCQLLNEDGIIPSDMEIQVRPRSGLSSKGIHVNFGTIDSGYTGELLVSMYNANTTPVTIKKYDRIAQLVVVPIIKPNIIKVGLFKETERGDKGFGSSGK